MVARRLRVSRQKFVFLLQRGTQSPSWLLLKPLLDHEPGLWACLRSSSWVTVLLVVVPSGAHVRQVVSEACPNAVFEAHHLMGWWQASWKHGERSLLGCMRGQITVEQVWGWDTGRDENRVRLAFFFRQ